MGEREREREREILGVNFTNVLRAAFMLTDPKRTKRQSSHQCIFVLLDSAHVKATCKKLMKSTPRYIPLTLFLFHRYLEKEVINDLSEVKQNLKEDQIKSIKVLWSFKQNLFLIGLHFTICLTGFLFSILVLILKNVTL